MKKTVVRNHVAKFMLCLAVAVMALVGTSKPAQADIDFEVGTLSTHLVACETLCTSGTLTGGLSGTLDYALTTMNATPNPDVVVLHGVITVTRASGTLTGPDVTLWNLATGHFVSSTKFTSGTGSYAGATGNMFIVGTFDLAAGLGSSNYTAIIKTP
jgi:hypothetical protein